MRFIANTAFVDRGPVVADLHRRCKASDAYTESANGITMSAVSLGFLQLAWVGMDRGVDPHEILQYFSWWVYLAIAVGYTVFVFLSGKIDKFVGFDRRNQHGKGHVPGDSTGSAEIVGPFSRVLQIHGWFLLILLLSLRIVAFALPYLPHWLTDTFDEGKHGHTSVADYLFVMGVAALAFFERKRLCSRPKTP